MLFSDFRMQESDLLQLAHFFKVQIYLFDVAALSLRIFNYENTVCCSRDCVPMSLFLRSIIACF